MKLLRAFVASDSVVPVLSALRETGGRPLVLPDGESTFSEYESLLSALASDQHGGSEIVRIRAICGDDDADRAVTAVTAAAQAASRGRSIVLVTPWDGKSGTNRPREADPRALIDREKP